MATKNNLIGAGTPALAANLLGFANKSVTGAGTSQSSGPVLEAQSVNSLTTASSQTACTLPSPAQGSPVGDMIYVACITSTTGLVFPDTGSQIDLGTATTGSVVVAQDKMRLFIRVSPTQWKTLYNS